MIKLTREEIRDYLKEYYSIYSIEELKNKLLEHGASLDDVEEEIKILNSYHNQSITPHKEPSIDKVENKTPLDNVKGYEKRKTSLSTKFSLIITLLAILVFGSILFFPDDVASRILSDNLESSSYFTLESSTQISIQENSINMDLMYISDMNAQINSQDSRNFITLNSGQANCNLQSISDNGELTQGRFNLEKNSIYTFSFSCPPTMLDSQIIIGTLNLNLFDTTIQTNIHFRDMPFRIINR